MDTSMKQSTVIDIEELKRRGYETVEGADVGDVPHLRMMRESGGDTIILIGTPHGRGPRKWSQVWNGSSARGLDEWATRVGQPAMDVVAAEVAARNARTRKPIPAAPVAAVPAAETTATEQEVVQ